MQKQWSVDRVRIADTDSDLGWRRGQGKSEGILPPDFDTTVEMHSAHAEPIW